MKKYFPLLWIAIMSFACSGNEKKADGVSLSANELKFYSGKGVGPVKEIVLRAIDSSLAIKGESLFNAQCVVCHNYSDKRKIGPGLKGITQRRTPEYILNQILNPMQMTKEDSLGKELLQIYLAQMTDLNLTEAEARSVLEYFRKADALTLLSASQKQN